MQPTSAMEDYLEALLRLKEKGQETRVKDLAEELKISLLAKNIRLNMTEAVIDMLADKGYDAKMGARPLSRKIDQLIRVPLSKRILFDRLSDCDILADMNGDDVVFDAVAHEIPVVGDDGIIRFPTP